MPGWRRIKRLPSCRRRSHPCGRDVQPIRGALAGRRAHASWLLAGGADIQVVKERLGHGSLRTTEKYLHTLPDHDDTALDALRRTRTRTTN